MLDTVIIGSGPAGITAAIYASRAALNYIVLEKAGYAGGQIVTTNDLDNYPAMPNIDGASFAMALQEHAEKLGANIQKAQVTAIKKAADGSYVIKIDDGKDDILTKTIILATGANPRHLNIPGEDKYLNRGVHYCATCDGAFYRKKTTAVIGGGNTALEDALFLSNLCEKVYLIHRRDELRGDKHSQEKIFAKNNIEFIQSAIPKEIKGDNKVTSLEIEYIKTGKVADILLNGIFVAVGMIPNNNLVPDFVDKDNSGYVIADEMGRTNAKGFFVAGDLRNKELRQVITAASDGANVIKSVSDYLNML